MSESFASDGTETAGTPVLWGAEGPAYARGWRDCTLSLAAVFEQRASDRHYPAALYRLAMRHAAELARQRQDGPGAPSGPASGDQA